MLSITMLLRVLDHRAASQWSQVQCHYCRQKTAPNFIPCKTNMSLSRETFYRDAETSFPPLHMDSLSYLLPASSLPVLQGFLWFRLDYTSKITLPLAEYFLPMISLANTAVWCLLHLNEMLVLLTMLLQGLWNQNVGRKAGVSQRRARGKWIHSSWRKVHNKHWSFAVADASSIELSKINEDTRLLW